MNAPSKEVAWVIGPSAAGKQTFIHKASTDSSVKALFDWEEKEVVAVPASLEYIKQSPDDPISAKRNAILIQVPKLLDSAEVALIKWQFVDMEDPYTDMKRVEALTEMLPEATHRAIVLHAPAEDLAERLPNKPWWVEYGSDHFSADEVPLIMEAVRNLPDNMLVTHINSGVNQNYTPYNQLAAQAVIL